MKRFLWVGLLALGSAVLADGEAIALGDEPAEQVLARYRKQIDVLDKQIVSLLNRRASIALDIGRIRARENISPASANERQKEVLHNAMANSVAPLSTEAARRIYEAIIKEMVSIQSVDRNRR